MTKKNGLNTEILDTGMTLQTHYKNGLKDGSETYFYASGQKASEGFYENDKPDGLQTAWDQNGQIESEQEYKNGVLHGKSIFYEDGSIASEYMLKNGDVIKEITKKKTH